MAKAMKSLSIFVVCVFLLLVVFEARKIEGDDKCHKTYEGYPPARCLALIYPSLCYWDCIRDKGALGGKCISSGEGTADSKCVCDFCCVSKRSNGGMNIMQANAA